ncbi:hypothetical protein EsH8_II_000081 [Colletotrichum jinshuiense]
MADQTTPTASPSDVAFMVQIFQHMQEKPHIDWDAFAAAAGFKSAGVAQTRYGQIKRKFNPGASPSPKKRGKAQGSSATSGSDSKVKKNTGRVGAKGAKETTIKSEQD